MMEYDAKKSVIKCYMRGGVYIGTAKAVDMAIATYGPMDIGDLRALLTERTQCDYDEVTDKASLLMVLVDIDGEDIGYPVEDEVMIKLEIIGPNLPATLASKGDIHVHAEGCADTHRGGYRTIAKKNRHYESHATVKSVVESFYGPEAGSFYEEQGYDDSDGTAWQNYIGEFYFAPCTEGLK